MTTPRPPLSQAIGDELAAQRARAAERLVTPADEPPHPLDVAVERARTDSVYAAGLSQVERRRLSDWTAHRAATTTDPKDAA